MVIELIELIVATCLIIWSNIITYNIPIMENKLAERLARTFSFVLVFVALGLIVNVR